MITRGHALAGSAVTAPVFIVTQIWGSAGHAWQPRGTGDDVTLSRNTHGFGSSSSTSGASVVRVSAVGIVAEPGAADGRHEVRLMPVPECRVERFSLVGLQADVLAGNAVHELADQPGADSLPSVGRTVSRHPAGRHCKRRRTRAWPSPPRDHRRGRWPHAGNAQTRRAAPGGTGRCQRHRQPGRP